MVVIDASVAAKWYLLEHDRSLARALLLRERLIAPEIIVPEVLNALWKNIRRGHLTADQIAPSIDALLRSIPQLFQVAPLAHSAAKIAFELDHPIYDCFYIALAEHEGVELVTADDKLYRKTRRTPFSGTVRKLA